MIFFTVKQNNHGQRIDNGEPFSTCTRTFTPVQEWLSFGNTTEQFTSYPESERKSIARIHATRGPYFDVALCLSSRQELVFGVAILLDQCTHTIKVENVHVSLWSLQESNAACLLSNFKHAACITERRKEMHPEMEVAVDRIGRHVRDLLLLLERQVLLYTV